MHFSVKIRFAMEKISLFKMKSTDNKCSSMRNKFQSYTDAKSSEINVKVKIFCGSFIYVLG